MKLVLKRIFLGDFYTIGELYVNGDYFCDTLEDKVRNGEKIPGETAIPAGTYRVTVSKSPKFGRDLPMLCSVPNFTGIRIHRGNTAKDTAGCILVGENTVKGRLNNSTKYEEMLTERLQKAQDQGETITIEIK